MFIFMYRITQLFNIKKIIMKQKIFLLFINIFAFATVANAQNGYTVRALEEVNDPNNADAYPWISGDALHIYFTREVDGIDCIFFSERKSTEELFLPAVLIEKNGYACFFTNDERTMYVIKRADENGNIPKDDLYMAKRNNKNEAFGAVSPVKLEGVEEYSWITSPSLTPDGKTLVVKIDDNVCVFQKKAEGVFTFVKNLTLPVNDDIVGTEKFMTQFTKEGKHLILIVSTALDEDVSKDKMFLAEWDAAKQEIKKVVSFDTQVNDEEFGAQQGSLSNEQKFLIFVRGDNATWGANDMYLGIKQ